MDPTANLVQQRELALKILNSNEGEDLTQEAMELADLVMALDKWIRDGGFLPATWRRDG